MILINRTDGKCSACGTRGQMNEIMFKDNLGMCIFVPLCEHCSKSLVAMLS